MRALQGEEEACTRREACRHGGLADTRTASTESTPTDEQGLQGTLG